MGKSIAFRTVTKWWTSPLEAGYPTGPSQVNSLLARIIKYNLVPFFDEEDSCFFGMFFLCRVVDSLRRGFRLLAW